MQALLVRKAHRVRKVQPVHKVRLARQGRRGHRVRQERKVHLATLERKGCRARKGHEEILVLLETLVPLVLPAPRLERWSPAIRDSKVQPTSSATTPCSTTRGTHAGPLLLRRSASLLLRCL